MREAEEEQAHVGPAPAEAVGRLYMVLGDAVRTVGSTPSSPTPVTPRRRSIQSIAKQAGYESASAFAAAFKQLAGDKKGDALRSGFAKLALSFAGDAAKKAGGALLASYVSFLG